jgi:putative addiction module CopG family antidote
MVVVVGGMCWVWQIEIMRTLTVELPAELARLVDERVASGRYADAGEVIRDALRQSEADEGAAKVELQAALAPAIADLDQGRILQSTILDIIDAKDPAAG